MMDSGPLPDTREVLCQHLHAKVRFLSPALVDQVTDLLANGKSNSEIISLLTSDSLLEENVNKIIISLSECDNEVRESLGAEVFQAVTELEQELCAQVTGMLMELPVSTITHLLTHPSALSTAVAKARAEYLAYLQGDQNLNSNQLLSIKQGRKTKLSELCRNERGEVTNTFLGLREEVGAVKDGQESFKLHREKENALNVGDYSVQARKESYMKASKKEGDEKCSEIIKEEFSVSRQVDDRNSGCIKVEKCSELSRESQEEEEQHTQLCKEKEALGEELYYTLSTWHPHLAPRLTGMLLQMNLPQLQALVADPELLRAKTSQALSVLEANQQTDIQ